MYIHAAILVSLINGKVSSMAVRRNGIRVLKSYFVLQNSFTGEQTVHIAYSAKELWRNRRFMLTVWFYGQMNHLNYGGTEEFENQVHAAAGRTKCDDFNELTVCN